MKVPGTARVLTILLCLLVLQVQVMAQQYTLTGQILASNEKNYVPRFNLKLYPPKTSGKPILVTTSDVAGRFRFGSLSPTSYLLEIYLGKDLVYQEVINMTRNTERRIDLRKK